MSFTAQALNIFEIVEQDAFGVGGRTTTYRTATLKATGCDRRHTQVQKISASLSAVSIVITPLGADSSVASNALLFLLTDHPVDVRVGSSGNTPISAVYQLLLAATISSLFITTGSHVTTLLTEMAGGSGATITQSVPMP